MELVKPAQLGLSFRCIEYRKRFGLSVSGYLHVPFAQGDKGTLWGEQSLWSFLTSEMALPLIDEGVAKLTPEFLVHGRVCPPPQQPGACAVRVRLGAVEKTLLAFGDRYWDGERASVPAEIGQLALDWRHAYGGADFALNPEGRGRQKKDGVHWLPNFELPADRLRRPDQAIIPAGFGPLEVMHPQRAAHRGTYDADYLKMHSPGFAPDMDWKHFNMAPADQWFSEPLRGDEPFSLDHLHPTQANIGGALPGLRVRVFAEYGSGPADESAPEGVLREVPMRLTTVWFFPHAERLVLVFHGLAEVDEDDASDVRTLLGGAERLGEPRSDAHYVDVLRRRRDPEDGMVESLNDHDLLPAEIDIADPSSEAVREGLRVEGLVAQAQLRKAQAETLRVRQLLVSQGKDPDAMGVKIPEREEPPPPAQLSAYLKAKRAEMVERQWDQVEEMLTHVERMQAMLVKGEITPQQLDDLQHRGPPAFRAQAELSRLSAQMAARGQAFDAPALAPGFAQKEAVERQNYLQSAHLQPPAHPLAGAAAAQSRDDMAWMLEHGLRSFPGMDFTGADLSGLDLRGADFSGAWLESANLCKSNVSGANFTAAVLAHADLRELIAIGANFTASNLGRARLEKAVFDDAQFTGSILSHSDFARTQFRQARISGVQWFESLWGQADWSGVQAPDALFHKFDMKGMVLAQADLSGSTFIECDLSGVDLRAAVLERVTFMTCKLDGAQLAGAQLKGAVFTTKSSAQAADLSHANLAAANLGDSDLSRANLTQAVLDGAAGMPGLRLEGCDARLMSAKGALLRKASLRHARLAGADFKDAVLQHADLRGADLRACSLFGADLSRVRLDGDVKLEGALFKRARTWPRLSAEQQAAIP